MKHEWCHVLTRFDSDSDLIKDSEEGDEIYIEREVGTNGELWVNNLEIFLMCEGEGEGKK